jgi:hypothetical protein
MKRYKGWSVLALGMVSAACSVKEAPEARNNGRTNNEPSADSSPNAFPAEPSPRTSEYSMEAPPPAVPPPARAEVEEDSSVGADRAAPKSASRGGSPSDESRSRRPLEPDPARPGLGTTWGETRTSRVSSSPFERASRNPFELQSISYNDANGIDAMLRGGSFAAFQPDRPALDNGMLSVRVLDDNGSPLPTYFGSGRALVAGEHGQRYTIQIANRTANRFEAVVTVDGLDVIDGQPGSFDKRGYLVQPFDSVEIDGFRQSMHDVAAFRFGSVRGSYAAKKGNDRNVGVIGVAFFAERGAEAPWTQRELDRRNSADPFPGRFAAPPIAR